MVTLLTVIAIVLLVLRTHAVERRERRKLITKELRTYEARHNISLSTVFLRNHWAIALDSESSRLLYLTFMNRKLKTTILELDKIRDCGILKTYTSSRPFLLLGAKHKRRLGGISLQFKHMDSHGDYQIPFYHHAHDKVAEMKMLFQKARHWQRMISA